MLRMSQPAVSTTLSYYRQLSAHTSEYSNEVMVCACIYLAAKVFEDERKIRDILNTIYSAIKLYTLAHSPLRPYIDLAILSHQAVHAQLQPNYDLNSTHFTT